MKLEATREEMLERFRLYGEMFCTCYELCDGDDPADLDEFKIDYDTDICETLGLDPDEGYMVEMPDETEEVALQGIEIGDGDMVMIYVDHTLQDPAESQRPPAALCQGAAAPAQD